MPGLGGRDHFADRIYEAAIVPELWPRVLEEFAGFAESRFGILIATDGKNFRWVGSDKAAEAIAQEHYKYPGAYERTRRLLALHRAGFVTDRDVFTENEILSEPLFAEYMIPAGLGRGVATAIHLPGGETVVLHGEGNFHLGPFHAGVVPRLDLLRPHFARAALISTRLAFERARTAVETLTSVGFAACAVQATGEVLVANPNFESEHRHWTTRGGNRIALVDRRADRQLQEALQHLRSADGVRSVPLRPRDEVPPAILHMVPIRRSAHDLFARASAILVLTQPSEGSPQSTPMLQALFDLSAAEADIAARLANGQTIEAIALATSRSVLTVRNQVKSAMAKTGCHRQTDLVRLLTQLMSASPQTPQ